MQTPRPTGTRAGREVSAQQRFSAGCEATGFLVAHVNPFDLAPPDGVGDVVQCIAGHAPAMLYAGRFQSLHDDFGDILGHFSSPEDFSDRVSCRNPTGDPALAMALGPAAFVATNGHTRTRMALKAYAFASGEINML